MKVQGLNGGLSKQNRATGSNISIPSTHKLLDHVLVVKGKPGFLCI